ncbi:MAG TPA: RDD family protein [Opitutaceae bacterium]|nr:RDD family protein [Opitutaceae bacterium]
MNYATFWQRFAAGWLDFFVLLPLYIGVWTAEAYSKAAAWVFAAPAAFGYAAYAIYFHGRTGQTLGKRMMKIRVVRTTAERIDWREAGLRSSVDVGFAALTCIGACMAFAAIPDADYYVGWSQRHQNLADQEPSWMRGIEYASTIWMLSEVVVMLFNPQRRALHDFIAGTVVIQDSTR